MQFRASEKAVLGIDAAWTLTQPSGVALAVTDGGRWRLLAAVASYQRFLALSDSRQAEETKPAGAVPDASALLVTAAALAQTSVDLVAIDMPLSHTPILGRRVSDNAVSIAYGARKCGTHTPSAVRPGEISNRLREAFGYAGYPLLTKTISSPGLIEVYPHPALVELSGATERLPYKAQKAAKYWPALKPDARRLMLLEQWAAIVTLVETEISGATALLPMPMPTARGVDLKAFEDKLDAVVCTWVAICALEGRALPFGDDTSAIWIPKRVVAAVSAGSVGRTND